MFAVQPPMRPSRSYRRFAPNKLADQGFDPMACKLEFLKKDIIKPLQRPNIYEKFNIKSPKYIHTEMYKTRMQENTKWALETVKRSPTFENLPKVQPFKTYYFPPEYNNKNVAQYRSFSLKTDHVGIKVPNIKKVNDKESFLKMKEKFSISTESSKENMWAPNIKSNTSNGLSSKDYNIINFLPNNNFMGKMSILNKTLHNHKKGISEYYDLTKTFAVGFNKNYNECYKENNTRFRKFNGIFTDMYDSSHKNGNIIMPFGRKGENK